MQHWTRSQTLALAWQLCAECYGMGVVPGRNGRERACACVYRKIFRECLRRFCAIAAGGASIAAIRLEQTSGPRGRQKTYGLKRAEFCADFLLIAKRTLGADSLGWQVLRFHYLLGADWKLCSRKLGIDKGEFFHEVYRVAAKLGRAFGETQPYALWPLDEYFGQTVRKKIIPDPIAFRVALDELPLDRRRGRRPLRVPLQQKAA